MRMNVRYLLSLAHYYLRLYWWWMTSGSLVRFAAGYAVPILALVFLVRAVSGGFESTPDLAAAAAQSADESDSEVAGSSSTPEDSATGEAADAASASPTAAAGQLTYVVKSGDTLGAVCAAHVPSMSIDDCVAAIVRLNNLGGPNQIAVDQSLTLPAGGPSRGGSTPTSNTPATSTPAENNGASAPTSSGASSGTVAIGSVSSPVKPGETAKVEAKVPANASCSLSYAAPSGSPGDPQSFAKSADGSGNISWSWDVSKETKKGRGIVVVQCGQTSISAYIQVN